MKIISLTMTALLFAAPAFAENNCHSKAFKAGSEILKINAQGQPTKLSESEMGLILGEKAGYAIGMTGYINNEAKSIRVDFVSAEDCTIKSVRIEDRGW